MPSSNVTVVIATRNRRDDLRVALRSCSAQTPAVPVLVMDDASTDGTAEMIAAEFPQVKVVRSPERLGQSAQRNRAVRMVDTEFLISLDDDTELPDPHTVADTLAEFTRPDIAVVAIPFINVREGGTRHHQSPDRDHVWVANSFIAAAFAARTAVLRDHGAYRDFFLHRHEEEDVALRLIEAGYYIRFGNAAPLYHFVSPKRDSSEIAYLDTRNLVLLAWFNMPARYLPRELASYALRALRIAMRTDRKVEPLAGYLAGLWYAIRHWRLRRPIALANARMCEAIFKAGGCLPVDQAHGYRPTATPERKTVKAHV